MDRLPDDDPDTFTKTVHHFFQHGNEKLCRELSDGAIAHVKKIFLHNFLQDFNTAIKAYNDKMEAMSVYMRTKLDEAEAERLCGATVLGRQALGQAILDSLLSHCCKKEGLMISPALSRYMPEPITLDSDSDDTEESEASDDDAAAQAVRHSPTRNNPQREPTHDGRPSSPESQSRSVQQAYEDPPDPIYDVPSPEVNPNPVSIRETENGTIAWHEVEEKNFIFRYPTVGPGYYVVQCERAGHKHQFKGDPFRERGGANLMVRHFALKSPNPTCHRRKDAKIYTTDQIVMKFGYRVVDDEGDNVTAEWVENSNEHLIWNANQDSRASKEKQVKGKWKALAALATPPEPVLGPSSRGRSTSRGGSASRRRFRRQQARVSTLSSGSGASASAAGPSESRGPPVADMMDIPELYSNWNWNQLGGGGDMPPARIESDLYPAE